MSDNLNNPAVTANAPPPVPPPKIRAQSGTLRAAVFGVNDGLVSNLSLVMGIAGASTDSKFVLLAGVAGLLAGAFSMAAGEFISMKVQREVFENQIKLEERELSDFPERETQQLLDIYLSKGISPDLAAQLVQDIMKNPRLALETHAREELGINTGELGSPWGASIGSFFAFVGGAIIPVLPYVFSTGSLAFWWSVGLSGFSLLAVGAFLSYLTGKNPVFSGLRMLTIGGLAAAVTYLVGYLLGVSLV